MVTGEINYLEKGENVEDLISRQAVIEYIKFCGAELGHDIENESVREDILNMPPVTPTHGKCKDCKHRDPEDKKCDCGHPIQWQLPREDNWYCADFEKRKD